MEKIKDFTKVVNDIEEICEKIIRKSIPVIKKLKNEKLQNEMLLKKSNKSKNELIEDIQKESSKLIKDSNSIKKEVDEFMDALFVKRNFDGVESLLLTQVWLGEIYDCEGLDAFKKLYEDLKKQFENCTLENVLSRI